MVLRAAMRATLMCATMLHSTQLVPATASHPVVSTEYGDIKGRANVGGTVHTFQSVPFAKAPTVENELRFKPPVEPEPWEVRVVREFAAACHLASPRLASPHLASPPHRLASPRLPLPPCRHQQGVLDTERAKLLTNICPQLDLIGGTHLFLGEEDCLYLSVYAPASASASNPLPVVFWIFGGAYVLGDGVEFGLYNGEHLAEQHDVIVVSPNYRVGPFGFLAHEALKAEDLSNSTGNMGIMDQVGRGLWMVSGGWRALVER